MAQKSYVIEKLEVERLYTILAKVWRKEMKEYFKFEGTAKRQEYWAVIVLSIVAYIAGFILLESGTLGALIALVIFVAALWALIAVTVKRLRDAGLNTWWTLAILVPYVGTIASIVFGCIASKQGDTQ